MSKLNIFVPLQKVDAAKRLLYGVMTAEVADKSGEILDYASAKPAIQSWSDGMAKASGGKSLGNVRLMHGKVAVGRVLDLQFDDLAKSVSICVEVVDDNAWKLAEAGVLTGYSIGGGYARRWQDGLVKRYTPRMAEVSLVDSPCVHSATFELVKADGSIETVEFKAFEPGNDAVKAMALVLAKAAGKEDRPQDYLVNARADLIKAHADDDMVFEEVEGVWSMTKRAPDDEEDEGGAAGDAAGSVEKDAAGGEADPDPLAVLNAAMEKGAAALDPEPEPAGDGGSAAVGPFADLALAGPAVLALAKFAAEHDPLYKDLYNVEWLADLMARFSTLQASLSWEAKAEGDGSDAPQKAADILAGIGALLVSVATEEVAEAVASVNRIGGIDVIIPVCDEAVLALCDQAVELVKADLPLMEKIGARNSKGDKAKIKTIHDHAVSLGAECAGSDGAEKLAKAAGEVEGLKKAVSDAAPVIERLSGKVVEQHDLLAKGATEIEALKVRLADAESKPAPGKGKIRSLSKADDEAAGGEQPKEKPDNFHDELRKIENPIERARAILAKAAYAPGGRGGA